MSGIFKNLMLILTVCPILFVSCEGIGSDQEGNGQPESTQVPDGVLRVFVDKTGIKADGSDAVTFRVMYGSDDVSTANTMHLIRSNGDQTLDMAAGANSFSTTVPGTYVFKAYLYRSGDIYSDNEVVVTATPVETQMKWRQKTVALQFTAVGCTNCPSMSRLIKTYQQEHPGEIIPLAFHTNYEIPDPMAIAVSDTYHSYFKLSGYPSGVLNFRYHSTFGAASNLEAMILEEKTDYPSTCGVALDTYYDSEARKAEVVMKVTSSTPSKYKYHIYLVEDGIEYMQAGVTGQYVHDNVVRYASAPDVKGTNMNDQKPFVPGAEVQTLKRVIEIPQGWKPENIRVVGVAMSSSDNGTSWECNNAAECRLGTSCDYEF